MQTVQLSIQDDTLKEINSLTEDFNLSRDDLMNDIFLKYDDYQAWCEAEEILQIIEAVDRGEFVLFEEVLEDLRKLGYNVS